MAGLEFYPLSLIFSHLGVLNQEFDKRLATVLILGQQEKSII